MGVLTLAFGAWQDALFLAIVIANTGIGIAQELRAKRKLDRLAALVAPHATVVRDGQAREVAVEDVIDGDLVRIEAGDQVVADGTLDEAAGLRLDESILTGESRPVASADAARRSAPARSRSRARARSSSPPSATQSYAQRIAGEARQFRHPRSPLERALNRLLLILVAVMVPLGDDLRLRALAARRPDPRGGDDGRGRDRHARPRGARAAPAQPDVRRRRAAARPARRAGAAAERDRVARLRRRALPRQDRHADASRACGSSAIEPGVESPSRLGRFAASSPAQNATLRAIADARPGRGGGSRGLRAVLVATAAGARSRSRGERWRLGAPELFDLDGLGDRAAAERAARAWRVLAFGETAAAAAAQGLVVLAEELRRRRALDGRVLPPRGRRAARDLRRQARHGRGDRARRRHPGRPGRRRERHG